MDRDEVIRVLRAFESSSLEYVLITLFRLKKGTVRARDHVDAAALRERFSLKEEI